ncbi:hypothetical protein EGR_00545 [Echinococcus granulosus]|uniref:Uncharacterized protein n=1 Tax=Echinococcus granulosus TaxID=6210 RepID=W6USI5_ECHGR|nr:hypothetical protein EGR_00545 [Echinococcus granulosus]EUB64595.1 hypothetical protein EGR_00545 [Echinococcus granulosus]
MGRTKFTGYKPCERNPQSQKIYFVVWISINGDKCFSIDINFGDTYHFKLRLAVEVNFGNKLLLRHDRLHIRNDQKPKYIAKKVATMHVPTDEIVYAKGRLPLQFISVIGKRNLGGTNIVLCQAEGVDLYIHNVGRRMACGEEIQGIDEASKNAFAKVVWKVTFVKHICIKIISDDINEQTGNKFSAALVIWPLLAYQIDFNLVIDIAYAFFCHFPQNYT